MDADVELLASVPAMGPAFLRSLVPAGRGPARISGRTVVVTGLAQDRERFAAYTRSCGFTLREHVPPTWLFVLSFPLQVHLLAASDGSLRLTGVVHAGNSMLLHRPIRLGERLEFRVRATNLRPHRRGALVDLLASALVEGEPVWDNTSTYLAPGASVPGEPAPAGHDPFEPVVPQARWRLPADLGRRYRAVSGDPNPIHTSRLAARAFGFARPIIHGMWTHARALAALEGRLPDRYLSEASFVRPILLPATVGFHHRRCDDGLRAAVTTADGSRPHLLLRIGEVADG